MRKSELIEQIAKDADISKAAATRALASFETTVKRYVRKGGDVVLTGFGTFKSAKRAARVGRNPLTGAPIKIKARRVMTFKTSSVLNKSFN